MPASPFRRLRAVVAHPTALALVALLALTGCASGSEGVGAVPDAAPSVTAGDGSGFDRVTRTAPTPTSTDFPAFSATAVVRSVPVHVSPGGAVLRALADPQPSGAPLVFLVLEQQDGWVQVQLPVRPNGTTGWVRTADVLVAGVAHRLDVRLADHELDVYRFGVLQRTYPIGVGTKETPTPGGTFYLKELLQPPTPNGPYGPYAYGLSGFSNTLRSFAGGEGVIGIHGTDQPSLVGRDVSRGCIRLRNDDIRELVAELPLGTPVRILA